jgi:hypothetical protein
MIRILVSQTRLLGKIIFNLIGEKLFTFSGQAEIFPYEDKYLHCMSKVNGHLFKQRYKNSFRVSNSTKCHPRRAPFCNLSSQPMSAGLAPDLTNRKRGSGFGGPSGGKGQHSSSHL